MKKTYICTLYGNENFGNKLQNYALQTKLGELGFNVKTIKTEEVRNKYFRNFKNIIKFFLPQYHKIVARYNLFLKFSKNYLKYTNKKNSADYYVIGSDQVWNPNTSKYFKLFVGYDLLGVKISYAASIGISNISTTKNNFIADGLQNFKSISVREDSGKKIIEELTGRNDIEVLIDPTMLLTTEEWNKVSIKPKNFDKLNGKKYILNYFLGELSEVRKREIEKIAKDNDCEIINLLDKNDPFYISGPSEFLYLEKNAFLICTDSFHSSVFALLYDRPFVIFDREDNEQNMSSRLDTLINKFNLKNRRFNGKITKENLEHDYTEAYKILEKERKKSKEFLEKALDIK